MSKRDNFTKPTIDILGKRVGYLCSNPNCRKHTVGPNENPEKATLIGIAAHITAASPDGPRYNDEFSEIERIHIENGIWLCANCATLIDKDEDRFPVALLKTWKQIAENEMLENLFGKAKVKADKPLPSVRPFLEADLIWNHASRRNTGYSPKNPTILEDGQQVMVINLAERSPIIFWEIKWHFTFTIHNNSTAPAYNVAIEPIGEKEFVSLTKLNKVNNLPPFQSVDLEADYFHYLEDIYTEADKIMSAKIPKQLEGLALRITYQDEARNSYSTIVQIKNNELINISE